MSLVKPALRSARSSSYQKPTSPVQKGERARAPQGLKQPHSRHSSRSATPTSEKDTMSGRPRRRNKAGTGEIPEASGSSGQLEEASAVAQAAPEPIPDAQPVPRRKRAAARPRSQHLAHLALERGATDSSANETDEERGMPAMSNLSISAPSRSDVWDMPKHAAGERKEALNWQQSLDAQQAPIAKASRRQARPKSVALVDRSASGSAASGGDALTWQQELLRGSMPHSASAATALDWPAANSPRGVNNSPTKQRRKKGSGDQAAPPSAGYEPFELDDVFANNSSSSPRPPKAVTPRSGAHSAPPAQSKGNKALEPARYAGPAFSNSPSPHLLPTPSRLTRRTEVQA